MRRTIATLLSFSVVGAAKDSCPCFTAEQYDAMFASNPEFGCHYTSPDQYDPEIVRSGTVYLYDGLSVSPVAVIQAAVTVEDIATIPIEGGICGVGGHLDISLFKRKQVSDYGEGFISPEAFHDCLDIIQAKCVSMCPQDSIIDERRLGCGRMPFALN